MKKSGTDWIGEIPIQWELVPAKRLFRGIKRVVGDEADNYERLALTLNGVVKRDKEDNEGLQPEQFNSYQILKCNELVFKLIDLQNVRTSRVGLSSYTGIVSPAYIVLTNSDTDNRFYYYWFMDMYNRCVFNQMGGDGVRSALNLKDLLNVPIPMLSDTVREKIASFLDRKCSEIDEMIALQEKIVEELKAYKQSVITETVTKGLNPDIPMKDSGIDWIGEIPEHWETTKFKALFQIKKIIAGELGYDVLSVTQQGLRVKDLSKNEGQVAQDYSKYQLVDIDDFVMNHMDLLTGYIDCAKVSGVTSPDYRTFVNRNDSVAYNPFYLRIFQKCYKDKTFYHLGQGVSFLGRWRLPKEQLNAFVLPLPSLDEQKAIAEYLDTKCTEIDNLISIKLSKIDSLKEYKKSIIYEYVTGKKEVIE